MASMTYEEWSSYKQMVMGETPAWFQDPDERHRRFQAYRAAFDENCVAAKPLHPSFEPTHGAQTRAAVGTAVPEAYVVDAAAKAHPFARHVWLLAIAVLANLIVVAGPAFAGNGDVIVNGETLSPQTLISLEDVMGPLEGGRYWARENGDFGREGTKEPMANLKTLVQQRIQAERMQYRLQQQYRQRQQLMMQAYQNAMRQRQAVPSGQNAYRYGDRFSSGERYNNGSWSHYNGYSNYGVGGTGDGCIYTPNWSNC